MQHESFATILADYEAPPGPKIIAAYHPSPMKEVHLDLELPPPSAVLRRQQAAAASGHNPLTGQTYNTGFLSGDLETQWGGHMQLASSSYGDTLGSPGDHFSDLMQQVRPPGCSNMTSGEPSRQHHNQLRSSVNRTHSVPALLNSTLGEPSLAVESAFIFPSGLLPPAAPGDDGNNEQGVGAATGHHTRFTYSAPSGNYHKTGEPDHHSQTISQWCGLQAVSYQHDMMHAKFWSCHY